MRAVGDYDIEIPEDTESGMYSIRVGRFEDDSLFGCSAAFEIAGSDDTPDNGDSLDDDEDEDTPRDEDGSMSFRF